MTDFIATLKQLCELDGPSGKEDKVANFILNEIKDFCDAKIDCMGNVIAFKKGKNPSAKKVMLDAHMDEVGVIITDITDAGFLKFDTVGGISVDALLCKKVRFDNTVGIIGFKPIHQSTTDERKKSPSLESLYIDIGAESKKDAEKYLQLGDIGTFVNDWKFLGDTAIKTKALDDRIGCAVLISLLKSDTEYDFYATFTVGEELGLRGAKTAAFTVDPEYAIVLETTTASDIFGAKGTDAVCSLGSGVVVPFMDRTTLYDRALFDFAFKLAKENGIKIQTKQKVAGGNNAGSVSLSKKGVRTITLAQPCRYIHAPSSVTYISDIKDYLTLAKLLLNKLASGEFYD